MLTINEARLCVECLGIIQMQFSYVNSSLLLICHERINNIDDLQ